MSKIAWFITHDQYIDRRIFFFTDVFLSRGYTVKLFCDQYYDPLVIYDPSFVIRPEIRHLVRKYKVSSDEVDDMDKEIIRTALRKKHYKMKSRGDNGSELPDNVAVEKVDGQLVVAVKRGSRTTIFNSAKKQYFVHYKELSSSELAICEREVVNYLNGDKDRKMRSSDTLVKILEGKNADGHRVLYLHLEQANHLYEYDIDCEEMYEYYMRDISDYPKDVLLTKEFSFEDFRNNVYDYTKILARVNEELGKETPDVVYVADLPTLPIGIMLKDIIGCKLIMDCHEWWYKNCELWSSENPLSISISDKYEKIFYPQCDLVITVGEHLANRMSTHIGCKHEVIYSCMSDALESGLASESVDLRKIYDLKQTDRIAIFQGGMSTNRNLDMLARATKYLPSDCFVLLLTTGDYQEKFRSVLKNEGNEDRVIWGGWINQADLLKYTKSADLGIIPYTAINDYAECFVPNKMTEYFVSHVPVLFDDSLKELSYVLGENEVGFGMNLTDPKAFGEKIAELLKNEEILSRYRNNYVACQGLLSYSSQKRKLEQYLQKYNID